ncbi:MAG: multicopper oxidase domain-containing protein [Gemmatimonadaceae bacterium]|jgi:FtsP/CotA-like multicopper oxidase with cupredoxin domain|nr:multicopper oxidase domain-containing protein [Gemmatimonadaceae bacterium]
MTGRIDRRAALKGIGLGALGVVGSGMLPDVAFATWAQTATNDRARGSASFEPDVEIELVAQPGEARIRTGAPTRVWQFTGRVLKGAATSVQPVPGSYLGPTLRLRRGQKVRIRFRNALPEASIVHWHGLDVPEVADGHPHLAIAPNAEYVYEFEVINRAGTYWYHPHPHGRTGAQVYMGLAGVLIVTDDDEAALGLPAGAEDLVCVVQDRSFDRDNQFAYLGAGMMDRMHGLLGDRMLVNGVEQPTLSLGTTRYRLRVLNGSSSRVYKLVWDDGTPMTVVGADGGLLEQPLVQKYLTLAPSQRADLIVDLSAHAIGSRLQLRSAPFDAAEVSINEGGMMGGMMGGRMGGGMGGGMGRGMGGGMGGASVANGASLLLMTIAVTRRARASTTMPTRLSTYGPEWQIDSSAPVRRVTLDFRAGQWLLGGRAFDMHEVAPDEIVRASSTHVWEIANAGGMMGQQMAHPFHVHGTQFRVLSRSRNASAPETTGSVAEGLVDAGWKDTVLILPHETVRVQIRFTRYPGLYLYHCHILEHEDMGMMRNFRVTA